MWLVQRPGAVLSVNNREKEKVLKVILWPYVCASWVFTSSIGVQLIVASELPVWWQEAFPKGLGVTAACSQGTTYTGFVSFFPLFVQFEKFEPIERCQRRRGFVRDS